MLSISKKSNKPLPFWGQSNESARIILFAVDGSVTSRIMLQSIFAEEYQVSLFDQQKAVLRN